ncbi:hypothetical protein Unana1_00455 [Umbelopsis nana]
MDPGQKLLEKLKLVPNLVSEDPATTTPTNSSFLDLPFTEFSKLLDQSRASDTTVSSNTSSTTDLSIASDADNATMCSWDYQVGYPQQMRMDQCK